MATGTQLTHRPRVLVIAEAANPEWVSVPLVGWSLARALADVADVHLVTQVRNREAILRAGLVEGQDFTAIDNEAIARPLWALGQRLRLGEGKSFTLMQIVSALSYPAFERQVWRRFGAGIRRHDWDIVHRITPLSPTISSSLAPRCASAGVPFVLGPLNGGVPWPKEFAEARRREGEGFSRVRGLYKALPGRHRTLQAASAVLAGSRHTLSEIPASLRPKAIWLPENAVDPARFPTLAAAPGSKATTGPLRACFIGRMVPYKGPDMLLDAAAGMIRAGRLTLDMIGDGPLLADLRAQAEHLGIAGGVTFHGWLDHRAVAGVAGACDILAFPSIREFGGGVVLEAMALGLVPLIVDYAGPAELVTPRTGLTVPLGPRAQIVADFASALDRADRDRTGLAAMGRAGRDMVRERYTWAAKAAQVAEVYGWVMGERAEKPDFSMGSDKTETVV